MKEFEFSDSDDLIPFITVDKAFDILSDTSDNLKSRHENNNINDDTYGHIVDMMGYLFKKLHEVKEQSEVFALALPERDGPQTDPQISIGELIHPLVVSIDEITTRHNGDIGIPSGQVNDVNLEKVDALSAIRLGIVLRYRRLTEGKVNPSS